MYSLGQCLSALIVRKFSLFYGKATFLIFYFVPIASSSVTEHQ